MRLKNSWNKDNKMNHGTKPSKQEIKFSKYIHYLKEEKPKKKGNISNEEN